MLLGAIISDAVSPNTSSRKPRKPCGKCGGPKEFGKGRRYCEDCKELIAWEAERKAQWTSQGKTKQRPCKSCSGTATGKYSYCVKCREVRATKRCNRCKTEPIRAKGRRYCEACYKIARIERLKRETEYKQRKWASDADYRTRNLEQRRENRRKQSKESKQRERAMARIRYRIKHPNAKPTSLDEWTKTHGKIKRNSRLPIAPIAELINKRGLTAYDMSRLVDLDEAVIRRLLSAPDETKEISIVDKLCYALDVPTYLLYPDDFAVNRTPAS